MNWRWQPWARWIEEALLDPKDPLIVKDSRKSLFSSAFSIFLVVPRGPQSWNFSTREIKIAPRVDLNSSRRDFRGNYPLVDLANSWLVTKDLTEAIFQALEDSCRRLLLGTQQRTTKRTRRRDPENDQPFWLQRPQGLLRRRHHRGQDQHHFQQRGSADLPAKGRKRWHQPVPKLSGSTAGYVSIEQVCIYLTGSVNGN